MSVTLLTSLINKSHPILHDFFCKKEFSFYVRLGYLKEEYPLWPAWLEPLAGAIKKFVFKC